MALSLGKGGATEDREQARSQKYFLLYYIMGISSFEISLTANTLYSSQAKAAWLSSQKIFLPPEDPIYWCQGSLSNLCQTLSSPSLRIKTGSYCLMGSIPNFSPLLSQFFITQHEPIYSALFFMSYLRSLSLHNVFIVLKVHHSHYRSPYPHLHIIILSKRSHLSFFLLSIYCQSFQAWMQSQLLPSTSTSYLNPH